MRLLLDTHALIWFVEEDSALSRAACDAIRDPGNVAFLSVASLWEIAIKTRLGKLKLSPTAVSWFRAEHQRAGYHLLTIMPEHALATADLPLHHRDPLDRLLVVQALREDMTLVTHDRRLAAYGVSILWT